VVLASAWSHRLPRFEFDERVAHAGELREIGTLANAEWYCGRS
jgi:hypothetical protein